MVVWAAIGTGVAPGIANVLVAILLCSSLAASFAVYVAAVAMSARAVEGVLGVSFAGRKRLVFKPMRIRVGCNGAVFVDGPTGVAGPLL